MTFFGCTVSCVHLSFIFLKWIVQTVWFYSSSILMKLLRTFPGNCLILNYLSLLFVGLSLAKFLSTCKNNGFSYQSNRISPSPLSTRNFCNNTFDILSKEMASSFLFQETSLILNWLFRAILFSPRNFKHLSHRRLFHLSYRFRTYQYIER